MEEFLRKLLRGFVKSVVKFLEIWEVLQELWENCK